MAVIVVGQSVGQALTAPGTDSAAARLAEWARFHGLGWVVSQAEQVRYDLTKPSTGGTVAGGIPTLARESGGSTPRHATPSHTTSTSRGPRPPAPIRPIASAKLAHEGHWQSLMTLGGHTVMRAAFLRPDAVHTAYLVGVVWLDPTRVRFVLHPGYQVPGGSQRTRSDQVPTSQRGSILATFNSGFTMVDAHGGYWQGGHAIVPLRAGAASMVLHKDGTLDVRSWSGGRPGKGIDAVRQNLVLLVDHGKINPLVNNPVTSVWGATIGNAAYVWRSAVGVRKDGTVVVAVGPALDVKTLATIMQRAGAVRAMELDINPDWTNFLTYTHPKPGVAVPHQLTYDSQINPDRYLQPSSRDFVAVLPR